MHVPLLAELKRRRVFRALIGYGIAAFAVLQIVEPVMHGLHWPEPVLSYVVVALAAGFPIVVALAWIFDVSGGRIERAAPASGSRIGGGRGEETPLIPFPAQTLLRLFLFKKKKKIKTRSKNPLLISTCVLSVLRA